MWGAGTAGHTALGDLQYRVLRLERVQFLLMPAHRESQILPISRALAPFPLTHILHIVRETPAPNPQHQHTKQRHMVCEWSLAFPAKECSIQRGGARKTLAKVTDPRGIRGKHQTCFCLGPFALFPREDVRSFQTLQPLCPELSVF